MLVGGLGLGYTAHEVLADHRVERRGGGRDRGGPGRLDAGRHGPARPGASSPTSGSRGRSPTSGRRWPRRPRRRTTWCCSTSTTGPATWSTTHNAAVYEAAFLGQVRDGAAPRRRLVVWSASADSALRDGHAAVFGDVTADPVRRAGSAGAATSGTGSTSPGADATATLGSVAGMDGLPHRARQHGRGRRSRATRCGGRRPSGRWRTSRSAAPASSRRTSRRMARVKAAAAQVNAELGVIDAEHGRRRSATPPPRSSTGSTTTQFPIDVFQTGSGTSSNMNMNEVLATLAARAGRRRAPQRPRQRQPVQQRHLPDLDPRRRDARRPCSSWCRRSTTWPTALEAQGRGVRRRGEVRPHAPDGRDAGDARPGVRRLRRRRCATASSGSRRRCRGSPSCRWAARRSAPASTPRRASPAAVIAELADDHRPAVHRGPQPLRGAGRPGRAGRAVRAAAHDRGRPHQDLQRPALDGVRAAHRARPRSTCPTCSPGSSIMPGKVNPVLPEATLMVCAQVIGNDAAVDRSPAPAATSSST